MQGGQRQLLWDRCAGVSCVHRSQQGPSRAFSPRAEMELSLQRDSLSLRLLCDTCRGQVGTGALCAGLVELRTHSGGPWAVGTSGQAGLRGRLPAASCHPVHPRGLHSKIPKKQTKNQSLCIAPTWLDLHPQSSAISALGSLHPQAAPDSPRCIPPPWCPCTRCPLASLSWGFTGRL